MYAIDDNQDDMNSLVKQIRREGVELYRFERCREDGVTTVFFYRWNKGEYFILMKNGDVRSIRKLKRGKGYEVKILP